MKHTLKFAMVAFLAAGTIFAQAPARKDARREILKALNLSRQQKAQVQTILKDAAQSAKPLAQQLKQNRDSLAAAVSNNDPAKIQELSTTQGQLRGQILGIRSGAMEKFYGVLTPEQRTAADQARLNFKELLRKRLGDA